jgi:hypothetical protein
MTPTTILSLFHVFFGADTCVQSRCLAVKEGIHFTESSASNGRRDTHTDTQTYGRDFFKQDVQRASGAMINIPSFITIGSDIHKLTKWEHSD